MSHLLSAVAVWIQTVISTGGYPGVALLMAIESACIPLPSEVIMPFAGALTTAAVASSMHRDPLSLILVAFAGAFGCLVGSFVAYMAGAKGGREFILRHGKYVLLRKRDVERSEAWFGRWGASAVFLSRMLPVIRTFISLPAGIARMPLGPFLALSFIGSLPWCYLLAFIGMKLGERWDTLKSAFHGADAVICVILLAGFLVWLKHHLKPDDAPSDAPT